MAPDPYIGGPRHWSDSKKQILKSIWDIESNNWRGDKWSNNDWITEYDDQTFIDDEKLKKLAQILTAGRQDTESKSALKDKQRKQCPVGLSNLVDYLNEFDYNLQYIGEEIKSIDDLNDLIKSSKNLNVQYIDFSIPISEALATSEISAKELHKFSEENYPSILVPAFYISLYAYKEHHGLEKLNLYRSLNDEAPLYFASSDSDLIQDLVKWVGEYLKITENKPIEDRLLPIGLFRSHIDTQIQKRNPIVFQSYIKMADIFDVDQHGYGYELLGDISEYFCQIGDFIWNNCSNPVYYDPDEEVLAFVDKNDAVMMKLYGREQADNTDDE